MKTQLIEQDVRTPGVTVTSVTEKGAIIAMDIVLLLISPFCGTLMIHYLCESVGPIVQGADPL